MKIKSFILIAVSMLTLASCGGAKQVAQNGDARVMPQQKGDPVADVVKDYTSQGFKTESMAFTMYESIYNYRNKLINNANLVEVISDGIGSSSFAAEQHAANAAAISYATAAGSVIKGGMERDFGALSADNTWDAFHGAYVQDVANFVMPLLKKEMKFIKKEGNNYVVKIGYTIDEEKAAKARSQAAEKALKDVAGGMAFGEGVRKYVNELVKVE